MLSTLTKNKKYLHYQYVIGVASCSILYPALKTITYITDRVLQGVAKQMLQLKIKEKYMLSQLVIQSYLGVAFFGCCKTPATAKITSQINNLSKIKSCSIFPYNIYMNATPSVAFIIYVFFFTDRRLSR